MATSTCTYRHKYWEFWQIQHEVWPETLLLMSRNFDFDCFEIILLGSAFPHLQGSLFGVWQSTTQARLPWPFLQLRS